MHGVCGDGLAQNRRASFAYCSPVSLWMLIKKHLEIGVALELDRAACGGRADRVQQVRIPAVERRLSSVRRRCARLKQM